VKANAKPLLELASDAPLNDPNAGEYDVTVVVDAPTSDRIGSVDVLEAQTSLLVIDHHSSDDLVKAADLAVVDSEASATTVLVYKILSKLTGELSEDAAIGIAAGILDDTGYLANGSTQAVTAAIDVLGNVDHHANILVNLHREEPNFSERMATAKAVARAEGYKSGQTLLMIAHCGSEQAAAANALIDAGADIALVLTDRNDEVWVVGRLSEREDKLSLPDDLFELLVNKHGGEGGGHTCAGTAKLKTSALEAVKADCIQDIEQALGQTFGPIE
jgi:nanoRNase/pAp phosphatase (c-di-AMP/oligoRNAs hydrolase)